MGAEGRGVQNHKSQNHNHKNGTTEHVMTNLVLFTKMR